MTIDKAQAQAMLATIRANQARLDNCPKHHFNITQPPYAFRTKFTCTNCGGNLDALQAFAYAKGYEAAGCDPNEIIPGFR